MDRAARLGLAGRGLVYALIAVLALQLGFGGGSSHQADQKGAFQTLAQNPAGALVLWLVVAGFLAYAVELLAETVWGHRGEEHGAWRRTGAALTAVMYAGFGLLAVRVLTGSSGGGNGGEELTARVLGMPGGRVLVGGVGVVIAGVGIYLAVQGLRTTFDSELEHHRMAPPLRAVSTQLGRVGNVARGLVVVLAGVLVVASAVTFDPDKARGLDSALREVASRPYGPWLLLVVAVGLLAFAAFSVVEAVYRRL